MDGEKQEDSNSRIAAITFPSTSAAVTVATVCPCSASGARAPSSSLSIISSDRQAVQVIQHAIQRPHNMAAQFLQQMYAAQQQHLMLQTAALQQQHQHSPHLQSLATMHQASVRQRQSTSSSSEGLTHQPAGVSIALPASPVTTQLVGRTQNSISSGVSTTISQQAMLLGGRPANCNQAQMYLRTQMLILAPAASVAAVQSDLPPVTSCSSASNSSQVQNLVLHQLPGALAAAHNVILKPPPPCPALTPAASKVSICPPKSSQVTESSSERPQPEVTGSQGITPALSPAQMTLKQQLSCPPGHQGAHRRLILQQDTAASLNHRQHQSIPLSVSPHDSISNPPPFSSKIHSSPDTQSQTPRNSPASSSSLTSASSQTSIPAAKVLPQPPPLLAAPQRWSSFPQVQSRPLPPLILPRFPQNSPVTLQRLSQDVQTQVAQKEQEPPATERLVQTLYQNVPPPQTVAIDLKVQPAAHNAKPLSGQTTKGNSLSPSEKKVESPRLSPHISLPFRGSPEHNGAVVDLSLSLSSHAQIRPPAAEEPSQIAASSSNHPPPSPPQLPHILPAAVRCPSHPPSSPRSPFEPLTTHVLTHLVEGFVIQEGLEPFPVHPSSLEKKASPSDSQEIATSQASVEEESPLAANQSISSDSEMESNGPAVDGVNNRWSREVAEHGESVGGVLRCEYCGSRGYACAFLSSKRFCSMTCGRRFSKHIKLLRTGRWGHRATGRRERPPSRVNGVSREHFLKRIYRSGKARKDQEQEDEAPAPMTTRLRKQAERQREKQREKETEEREPEGQITETISISDEGEEDRRPSHWGVEQVFSYINSLPGGGDVAEEFRSQEIDGQALLLLTEDHLVSTMNLKLGPALKLHAYINSLKEA